MNINLCRALDGYKASPAQTPKTEKALPLHALPTAKDLSTRSDLAPLCLLRRNAVRELSEVTFNLLEAEENPKVTKNLMQVHQREKGKIICRGDFRGEHLL